MTATEELKPCPFCGWDGIHQRHKLDCRDTASGATCVVENEWGHDYELVVRDYRFGVKYWCGRCKASTGYAWGVWHIPDEDEIETFGDVYFNLMTLWNEDEQRDAVNEAIAAWNRRADHD